MADWNDLKRAFEKELNKQEKQFILDEQSLLETIAKYLVKGKSTSALQGYDAYEMHSFLQKPISEIKKEIGGQWASLEDTQLEPLVYSLTKKVQKSIGLFNRNRR